MHLTWRRVLTALAIVLVALALMGQSSCPRNEAEPPLDEVDEEGVVIGTFAGPARVRWEMIPGSDRWAANLIAGLFMADEDTGFMAGSGGYLGQTTDGLQTVDDISPGFAIDLQDVDGDGDRVMVTGKMGTVLDTKDLGGNWGLGMPPDMNDLPDLNAIHVVGDRAFVGGNMGVVWLVADTVITQALTGFDGDVVDITSSPDGETIVALMADGSVWASRDGGESWIELWATWLADVWYVESYEDGLWVGGDFGSDDYEQGVIPWADIAADVDTTQGDVMKGLEGEETPPTIDTLAGIAVAGAEGYDDPIVWLGGSTPEGGGVIMWVHGNGQFSFHELDDPVLALDVVETAGGMPRVFAVTPTGAYGGTASKPE